MSLRRTDVVVRRGVWGWPPLWLVALAVVFGGGTFVWLLARGAGLIGLVVALVPFYYLERWADGYARRREADTPG